MCAGVSRRCFLPSDALTVWLAAQIDARVGWLWELGSVRPVRSRGGVSWGDNWHAAHVAISEACARLSTHRMVRNLSR